MDIYCKRIRQRKRNPEYNLKLVVKDTDDNHLVKFVNDLESNYPIHYYHTPSHGSFINDFLEARLFITNNYMCKKLYEDYEIVPFRNDSTKLISNISKNLYKFFILGTFDGDGSFTAYQSDYGKKLIVNFGGSEILLQFIESVLVENKIVKESSRQLCRRHKEKDGTWRTLRFSGKSQGMNVLKFLYEDSPIYLDRKYQKLLEIPY